MKGDKKKKTVSGVNKRGNPYKHPATIGSGRNKKVRTGVNKKTGTASYRPAKQPKMVKVKAAPAYNSKKRKVSKRRLGKKI